MGTANGGRRMGPESVCASALLLSVRDIVGFKLVVVGLD